MQESAAQYKTTFAVVAVAIDKAPASTGKVAATLWHGTQDRAFSVHLAEEVVKRLPNCKARLIDNAGHYSLPIRYMRDILSDLISC